MNDCIPNEYRDIEQYAQSLGMTVEEYAMNLHEKNQVLKSVLLDNGSDFKNFVEDYHETLESLTLYKETAAKKDSSRHYDLIKKATHLLETLSHDPKLLAQLSQHYPEGIDQKINEVDKNLL